MRTVCAYLDWGCGTGDNTLRPITRKLLGADGPVVKRRPAVRAPAFRRFPREYTKFHSVADKHRSHPVRTGLAIS
jgi:hypothetical protein